MGGWLWVRAGGSGDGWKCVGGCLWEGEGRGIVEHKSGCSARGWGWFRERWGAGGWCGGDGEEWRGRLRRRRGCACCVGGGVERGERRCVGGRGGRGG